MSGDLPNNPTTNAPANVRSDSRASNFTPRARLAAAMRSLTLWAIVSCFALPLLWMLLTSALHASQTVTGPTGEREAVRLLDLPAQAATNYASVWNDPVVDFPLYLRNTLIITLLTVVGTVVSSSVVAYGLSRIEWRGRGLAFAGLLATMLVPFPVIMGPLYMLYTELGWIGTFKPLWVPAWFGHAVSIFLLRQFFMALPKELSEAARIDGCSHASIFFRIILPISRPALSVVALLQFVFVWSDFVGPLIFLNDRDKFTLALGLSLYQSQAGNTPWNLLMAATTIVVAPVVLVFVLAQRALIDGIATQGLREG
jgi:multiple sugar transport system permease protein